MGKGRLEAFSDGVLAIIITIMVLEINVKQGVELVNLIPLIPVFSCYVLSFVFLGIYWNNHHHMLQAATKVNGRILWANLHLLFWLSLIPFVTKWMGENHFAPIPTALYGIVLFMAALAYHLLTRSLVLHHGAGSALCKAIGKDRKGKISLILYIIAIIFALLDSSWIAVALYVFVAIMWFIPDRRIENAL
jgi:uncharacterized membrane protein